MFRKLTCIIMICAMLFVFVCGCTQKTDERAEYIGIISAMDNEIDLLLKKQRLIMLIPWQTLNITSAVCADSQSL